MRQPAIFPPPAAEQLSVASYSRAVLPTREGGVRTHAPAPPSSRRLLPSSGQACHSRAVRTARPQALDRYQRSADTVVKRIRGAEHC